MVAAGWNVRVVLPSSQKSWSGTNYSVSSAHVRYWYYYPLKDNFLGSFPGTDACWSNTRRPIDYARGEVGEWVLVDGTPSTCTNVGLFTGDELFGVPCTIDLVVSGPNFGRNTGTAFSVSSGTLGAALAGSLSSVRSVAISYAHFTKNPPTRAGRVEGPALSRETFAALARRASGFCVQILQQLWDAWDQESDVQAYSINVPIAETLYEPRLYWTHFWHSRHVQLYPLPTAADGANRVLPSGVPSSNVPVPSEGSYLAFRPNLVKAMCPDELEEGTDVWAVTHGYISISRVVASFSQTGAYDRPLPKIV